MVVKGLGEIQAVAFDIDGTLYSQWRLHVRAWQTYARHGVFFLKYGLVRSEMHRMEPLDNFHSMQAERMAAKLKCTREESESRLQEIVYGGLKKYFVNLPSYKYVNETFEKFRSAGLKLALLSDFPPEQKGAIWGVRPYCDVILGTEELGALKPAAHPFLVMAERLGVEPSRILYVGNSVKYDIRGARSAGMKTAYLLPFWRRLFRKPLKEADISFADYRQLQDIVLQ